jgi:alkyl sulfatase BDS1-like metallo-beta-lactamase superfamily hydrolase
MLAAATREAPDAGRSQLGGGRGHKVAMDSLPFDDVADVEAARRGLVAPLKSPQVLDANGNLVWDVGA